MLQSVWCLFWRQYLLAKNLIVTALDLFVDRDCIDTFSELNIFYSTSSFYFFI